MFTISSIMIFLILAITIFIRVTNSNLDYLFKKYNFRQIVLTFLFILISLFFYIEKQLFIFIFIFIFFINNSIILIFF